MANTPRFVFAVCQIGVEWALKEEVARRWPHLHFAFSCPGFVTFKVGEDSALFSSNPLIGCVFARTCGVSLGQADLPDERGRCETLWRIAGEHAVDHLHIWPRDEALPGEHGFLPGPTPESTAIGRMLVENWPAQRAPNVNELARPGEMVLDCVLVEPAQWWIGIHRADSVPQRWPGGAPKLTPPDDMISRAYLKTAEALAWSRLPAAAGDAFVEIGCAPGGSAQALLDCGYTVTGIDPAEVDQRLQGRAGFTHICKRGADLKRREYRPFRWLTADLNVAPNYTLDTVEHIVTHPEVQIAGMLLTLKLMDRPLYGQVGAFLGRVRGWGYEEVRVRQLAFNRHEVCLSALRGKSLRRRKMR